MQSSTWSQAIERGRGVLIVINSLETNRDEILATLAAVDHSAGLAASAAMVPHSLRSWCIRQGVPAARVIVPQLHGIDVEPAYFFESPFAVQWAFSQRCDFLLGTQSYLPLNEEVKSEFELRMASLVGAGRYVAHTLPDERLFVFTADDLWRRAGRALALNAHVEREQRAMSEVYRRWIDLGRPSTPAFDPQVSAAVATLTPTSLPGVDDNRAALQAAIPTLSRVTAALDQLMAGCASPPIRVAPAGAIPAAGWVPPHVEAVWEAQFVAAAVRWEGPRLAMRAEAEGAYSYLFVSAVEDLRRGDAVVASGRVYRGGITIGLQRDGNWVNRVDVDQPGPFVVMVVAQEPGNYQLGIANCLRGTELRTAFALRRFGWTRRER